MRYTLPAIVLMIMIVLSRFMDMPANFSPLLAITLLGTAAFRSDKKWAWLLPLAFIYISDLILNNTVLREYYPGTGIVWFHPYMLGNYFSIFLIALWGQLLLDKINLGSVTSGAIGAAILFFLVSNFGSWLTMPEYPKTISGLLTAYGAGIPFFRSTLLSNLLFCYLIMGAYKLSTQISLTLQKG